MATHEYPDQIYGKTWILWACTLIIGQAACLCCILGPLFWLDILKRADGQPGSFGGIHMTVIGSLLMPVAIMFVFQLFARQWPMIGIYKEGLQIREIGTPIPTDPILKIIGIGVFIIILVAIWHLITLQTFRIKTTRLRWEEITNIMQGTGTLGIAGWTVQETRATLDIEPRASFREFCYNQDSFGLPTDNVGDIIQYYRRSETARQLLRSWDDDFSPYRSFE